MIITIDMVTGEITKEGGTQLGAVAKPSESVRHLPLEPQIAPHTPTKPRKQKIPQEVAHINPTTLIDRMGKQ